MWPNGRLERFDEIALLNVHPNMPRLTDRGTGNVNIQKFAESATLEDFYDYIEESLRTYQGYYLPEGYGDDWRGYMPYAFLLQRGMKLVNSTTNARYTISEVTTTASGKPTGQVRLSGVSDDVDPPVAGDTLEFDRDCGIIFGRVSHRTSAGVDYEEDATRRDTVRPWCAHIDFVVLEEAPARNDPDSPRPTVMGRKRMFREVVEATEPGVLASIYGQWLDARVRFELWGATSTQAERLVYWFYKYMDRNRWIFTLNGVKEVHFERRGFDQPVGKWRQNFYHRAVDYFVRTEHHHVATHRKLEHIEIHVKHMQDRVLEDAQTPYTGRPEFAGAEVPVTVYPNET